MKHLSFFLAVYFVGGGVYAQQTVVVTKDKETYYEEYSVLESDKKIEHGSYSRLNKPIIGEYSLHSFGSYVNGQKDGYWEIYYEDNNNIREKVFINTI